MEGVRQLGAGLLWVLSGSVAIGAVQWVCIVTLGRSASAADIGDLTFAYALSAPFVMASNGQLRQLLAADVGTGAAFGDYMALRLVSATLAVVATLLAALSLPLAPGLLAAVALIAVAKWGEALSDLSYGLYQAAGRSAGMGQAMMARAGLTALIGVLMAVLLRTAPAVAAGIAVGSLGVFVAYDYPRTRSALSGLRNLPSRQSLAGEFLVWRRHHARRLLVMALPLGLASGLAALTWNLPRYFLQWHWGSREQGVFSALAVMPLAVSTLPAAIGQIMGPHLAELRAQNQRRRFAWVVLSAATGCALLALCCSLVASIWGELLLKATLGQSFAGLSPLLSALFAASLPQYVLFSLNAALVASAYYSAQFRALIPAAVVGALAGAALVPRLGVQGAVAAYGMAGLTQLALAAWLSYNSMRANP